MEDPGIRLVGLVRRVQPCGFYRSPDFEASDFNPTVTADHLVNYNLLNVISISNNQDRVAGKQELSNM